MISDGTCAETYCRIMPDRYCRECKRWYCAAHEDHGRTHAVAIAAVPRRTTLRVRPRPVTHGRPVH